MRRYVASLAVNTQTSNRYYMYTKEEVKMFLRGLKVSEKKEVMKRLNELADGASIDTEQLEALLGGRHVASHFMMWSARQMTPELYDHPIVG